MIFMRFVIQKSEAGTAMRSKTRQDRERDDDLLRNPYVRINYMNRESQHKAQKQNIQRDWMASWVRF